MSAEKINLFVYGSLRDPAIFKSVSGLGFSLGPSQADEETLPAEPALLANHRRVSPDNVYFYAIPDPASRIEGVVISQPQFQQRAGGGQGGTDIRACPTVGANVRITTASHLTGRLSSFAQAGPVAGRFRAICRSFVCPRLSLIDPHPASTDQRDFFSLIGLPFILVNLL